jgi:hypothetical protein
MNSSDESKTKLEDGGYNSKMVDEEKRKNFLERNRYVLDYSILKYVY